MKGLYGRGNILWMNFTVNGMHYQRSTGTSDKKLAEKIYRKVLTEIAEGRWFDRDAAIRHTYDEMMEKFMNEHAPTVSGGMQKSYKTSMKHLDLFFSGLRLADIDSDNIVDYRTSRRNSGSSPATRNREVSMLSKAFNLARLWKWTRINPCQLVKKEKEDNEIGRCLTDNEEHSLIEACRGRCNGHLADMVVLALNTGIREGQALKLRWDKIDMTKREFLTQNEKTDKWYSVSMNMTVFDMLMRKSKVRSFSGYVFSSANDTPFIARNMYREFQKSVSEAGIGKFRFHDLRHTCGTRIGEHHDILSVSVILDHSQLSTSKRYVKKNAEVRRRILSSLDRKNNGTNG